MKTVEQLEAELDVARSYVMEANKLAERGTPDPRLAARHHEYLSRSILLRERLELELAAAGAAVRMKTCW